jgi:hypothetical protein
MQQVVTRLADCAVVQAPGLVERVVRYNRGVRGKLAWIPNNIGVPAEDSSKPEKVDDPTIHLSHSKRWRPVCPLS